MKSYLLLALVFSLIFIQSCTIHRGLKLHQKGEYEKAWDVLEKLKTLPDSNDIGPYLKYSFVRSNISVFQKFECTDSLARAGYKKELQDIRKIKSMWHELGNDTSKIVSQYSLLGERFNSIEEKYLACIKLVKERDSLEAALKDSEVENSFKDSCLMAKGRLEEPNIITAICKFDTSRFGERAKKYAKSDLDSLDFSVLAEVVGENGEDIKLTFSLQYKGFQSYPNGHYKTPLTDDAIDWFATAVCELGLEYKVSSEIIGSADANKINDLKYIIGSNEWGHLNYPEDKLKNRSDAIRISMGERIENLELAFLRAYNAEKFINRCSSMNNKSISLIDHIALNDGKKGAQFRTVEIIVLVKNVLTDDINLLEATKYYEYLDRAFKDKIEFKGRFVE